jgi:hypothetical protein
MFMKYHCGAIGVWFAPISGGGCMTRNLVRILTIAAGIPLYAQSHLLTAKVPFDFTVGRKSFPAGEYTLKVDANSGTIFLQSADRRYNMFALTIPASSGKNQTAHLTFNRYGDQYFLSQIWGRGSNGREVIRSAAEREQIARSRPLGPATVGVAVARH